MFRGCFVELCVCFLTMCYCIPIIVFLAAWLDGIMCWTFMHLQDILKADMSLLNKCMNASVRAQQKHKSE